MRRIALGFVLLLGAVGCGSSNSPSSVCDNVGNALSSLPGKYSACGQLPAITFDKNQCVQGFNNSTCTDADRTKINDYASCLSALPNCTVATQSNWLTQLSNCASKLSGVNC